MLLVLICVEGEGKSLYLPQLILFLLKDFW